MTKEVVIVGGGILGLAHAYHAALKGKKVTLLERDNEANGASLRNFGMIISAFTEPDREFSDAIYGESIWEKASQEAGVKVNQCGALLVAEFPEEMSVLSAYHKKFERRDNLQLFKRTQLKQFSQLVNADKLVGGLWVPTVKKVDQRNAIRQITSWLSSMHNVDIHFNTEVIDIDLPKVQTNQGTLDAQQVIVCGGNEFRTLCRDRLSETGITSCQLQMMRTVPQDGLNLTEPFILGGLSYSRYAGFQQCREMDKLKTVLQHHYPEQLAHGIHVIVAQESDRRITLGDSHHYGDDILEKRIATVDDLILEYASKLVHIPDQTIEERWLGRYAYLPEQNHLRLRPQPGLQLVTITNGQGMTMGFSLAKDIIDHLP